MSKVAKGKRKTRGKDGKGAEEQDNESTYSFQSYDSKRLFMFLYQGWYLHKEKEILFLTACLEIVLFLSSLGLLSVFFPRDFLPLLIFP